jgi:hypothetical protein
MRLSTWALGFAALATAALAQTMPKCAVRTVFKLYFVPPLTIADRATASRQVSRIQHAAPRTRTAFAPTKC